MAKIVAAYAVPHTPSFIADVAKAGEAHEAARFFSAIKTHLDKAEPDVLVLIQNDHFNTYFFDNWPTFAIGVASETWGPSDQTPGMPNYRVKVEEALAALLTEYLVAAGFDLSVSQEFSVDHAVLVPLHFLTPQMQLPIVPLYINCLVPPLPSAKRCYALGQSLRHAIESWSGNSRVAVITSGSLSLEVGGPLMEPGKTFGVPDKGWASRIIQLIKSLKHDTLIAESTPSRMAKAGNVGGEVLNWIALLGLTGLVEPDSVIEQPALGNAFAAWSFAGAAS